MNRNTVTVGEGQLFWPATESHTDRYGSVVLVTGGSDDKDTYAVLDRTLQGRHGTLTAVVVQTGDEILLGSGTVFIEQAWDDDDAQAVGLRPDDGRSNDWLNQAALRSLHAQVVRLVLTGTTAPV